MFAESNLEAFFRQLVDSWHDGVLLVDDSFTIRYCNQVFQNMISDELISPATALAGQTVQAVFRDSLSRQLVSQADAVFKANDNHWLSDHIVISDPQGGERHFSLQLLPLSSEQPGQREKVPLAGQTKWVAVCLKNISALIRHEIRGNELELELQQNSLRDETTGLSSRAYWEFWLSCEFNRSKRYQQDLSIILIDLATHHENLPELPVDAFVNVLADVAQLTQRVLRNSDQAARYSDKRIVALLPHTNGAGAEYLAARIRSEIDRYLGDKVMQQWFEFRIGIAVYRGSSGNEAERDIDRYDDLLRLAEDDLLAYPLLSS